MIRQNCKLKFRLYDIFLDRTISLLQRSGHESDQMEVPIIDEFVDDNPNTRQPLNNMGEEGWELVSVVQIINTEPKTEVVKTLGYVASSKSHSETDMKLNPKHKNILIWIGIALWGVYAFREYLPF